MTAPTTSLSPLGRALFWQARANSVMKARGLTTGADVFSREELAEMDVAYRDGFTPEQFVDCIVWARTALGVAS